MIFVKSENIGYISEFFYFLKILPITNKFFLILKNSYEFASKQYFFKVKNVEWLFEDGIESRNDYIPLQDDLTAQEIVKTPKIITPHQRYGWLTDLKE